MTFVCAQIITMHQGKTLLHLAAIEGRLNVFHVLLEHNGDITTLVSMY